ncbi:YajQ family cyclic di-GMP-binding protein [Serinicoccus kebangsaanensis]|uniref:YajQ family cyclic di-GMP-binding protein n=1 Tax=Serinicoccus kebangsaanensis TaxID=2602069 RepID=UPI00124C00FA|nr:YajQ family cyclic di-GMP-binding protein [Serinicoccus kebangsaanensis]
MADSSFDIVSKVDHQEVANAVNQAAKEIGNRYDFRGVGARVELSGESISMAANSEERCKAVLDVLQTKLVKRGVSLKHLDYTHDGEPYASGKEFRLEAALKSGISSENAKKIGKIIRDEGPKGVKAQIQGDELRVTSKSRDDLQAVQRLLKEKDLDVALQFTNYR